MPKKIFNLVLVAQAGRLQYEAVLFLASLRANSPKFKGKVFVAEPQRGPAGSAIRRLTLRVAPSAFGHGSRDFSL